MPNTPQSLLDFLGQLAIATNTVEHPPVFTVAEAKALRGSVPGGHAKNLFLKDKKDNFFLVVAAEDAEIDLKTLHRKIGGQSRFSFGKPESLMELLGVEPGSVTPFAIINDGANRVKIVVDAVLMRHSALNFHPLVNTMTTAIGNKDLVKFIRATGHEPAILNLAE